MELKPTLIQLRNQDTCGFNRTTVELKLNRRSCLVGMEVSFNRTTVELKPKLDELHIANGILVLIVPQWN